RWKVAAEQEAAAGKAVEQEFLAQVCYLLTSKLTRYAAPLSRFFSSFCLLLCELSVWLVKLRASKKKVLF
ncbi:MAG: hypothetical protein Q8835_03120, partial [Sweet potato little leaf phytoplasma]|nr:hypothetical protein [Sweet potato little leaf phytoplasma]